jgi:Cu/Ag efflux pump CusA
MGSRSIRGWIPWLVVLVLVMGGLGAAGVYYFFQHLRTAAGRPAPRTFLEVVAVYPGASAEEVERQVAIPLEVTFAGTPGLKFIRSKSQFGLAFVRLEFESRIDYSQARQEVINRLATISQPLPAGVIPAISPSTAGYEILRYTLRGPRDAQGKDIYTLADLRALQDWVVEREFRRVPRIIDVVSAGGAVRRYEVHPDPDRLRRYGITLQQLQNALVNANANVGGDFVIQGHVAMNVRAVGLFGGGEDPVQRVLSLKDPAEAAARLRSEEQRRIREVRSLVVATVNQVPVHLEDLVEGGRLVPGEEAGCKGVVVGRRPGEGRVGFSRPGERDEDDLVLGVVLLRPGEDRQAALDDVKKKVQELNDTPGRLLPGVRLETFWERAGGSVEDLLVLQADFPANVSPQAVAEELRKARALLIRRPEVRAVLSVAGPNESGLTPAGAESAEVLVLLHPGKDRQELAKGMQTDFEFALPGIDWDFLPDGMDDFQTVFDAVPGGGLLKIIGPDLDQLEQLAGKAKDALRRIEVVSDVHVRRVLGKQHLEFRVDPEKCKRWGVSAADVNNVIQLAVGGQRAAEMIEGEKVFDITLLWPLAQRRDEESILDIPLDVTNNAVAPADAPGIGPAPPIAADGLGKGPAPIAAVPRLRLRDVVSPLGADGQPDPKGAFLRPGAAAIWREQGRRLIAVRFGIHGRKGADVVAEAERTLAPLFAAPYRAEWSVGDRQPVP